MAVKTYDYGPPTIARANLRRQRATITWAAAWGVLVLGWLGTIVAANGGWGPFLALEWTWTGWIGGAAAQLLLTWLQWSCSDIPLLAWTSRAVDALLTALGYGVLVVGSLIAWLVEHGLPAAPIAWGLSLAGIAAWGILWAICLIPAWWPEHRLVK